jgi:hypothetical protein
MAPHTYIGPNALSNMFLFRDECNAKAEKWGKKPSLSLFLSLHGRQTSIYTINYTFGTHYLRGKFLYVVKAYVYLR